MEKIFQRLDNIENILKMLLINNVMNEDSEHILVKNITNELRERIEPLGFNNIRINYIEGHYYIFANLEINELKRIREIYVCVSELLGEYKLVLTYEKLSKRRKQALEKSDISFCISSNGEMKIF